MILFIIVWCSLDFAKEATRWLYDFRLIKGLGNHRVLYSASPSDADDLRDRLCLVEFEEQVLTSSHKRRGLHLGARACGVGVEILVEQGSRASLRSRRKQIYPPQLSRGRNSKTSESGGRAARATSHVGSIRLALARLSRELRLIKQRK
jgi:hypothetical protein